MGKSMERKDIQKEYKWKTEDLFESDEAWEKEFRAAEKELSQTDFSVYSGKLADKQTLLACLQKMDEVARRLEKLYLYAHLRHDEDLRDSKQSSSHAVILALYSKTFAEFSYVEPELTAIDSATLDAFIQDEDFAAYEYRLRKVAKSKEHVLGAGEEKLLTLASEVMGGFQSVFMMLDNANLNLPKATLNGEEVQMTHGGYGLALHNGTTEERKEWFEKYYDSYIRLIDAITQTYYNNVKKDVFYKTARGYATCMEMAMDGEDVPKIVYENLLDATHEALPILHDYIALRKEVLGLDEQHMYDLFVPLVENADIKLPFDEAYAQVVEGLAPLGKDYQEILLKAKKDGWMDVYETEGKRNGAYSSGVYVSPHPYVLLNYQPTTNDMFTIAHELGHAIHSYKSNQAQPYPKADYTIFLAEIASTVNEVLLLKHLYKNTQDKNVKKYLLSYYMDSIRATWFRQTQFAEFEQIAHAKAEAGEALTKECLNEEYYALNKQYYGEGITHDSKIAYEWARIPHFYSSFYVYKYATGIISAISIVKRILSEGESAVKDYFAFLSSGGCTDPITILKKAGVDLTQKTPFEAATQEFASVLQEFKSLL